MMRKCILKELYYVPVEAVPDLAALKRRLTINPIWFDRKGDRPRPIKQYVLTDDDYIGLPVWFGIENYSHLPITIRTSRGGELHAPKRPDPNHEKVHNKKAQAKFFVDTIKHFESFPVGLAVAGTGTGKCLAPDTPVMLYSGDTIRADDVEKDDLLMGPDSTPRKVQSITSGIGPRYKITPVKGEPWFCNDAHILSLVHTVTGEVIDVAVSDYMKWNGKKKHCFKLYRVSIDFGPQPLPAIDPYFMGVLLGDGSLRRGIAVTSVDTPIIDEVRHQAKLWSLEVRRADITYYLSQGNITKRAGGNALLEAIRGYGLRGAIKFIPEVYKFGSRAVRLQVLAGLIDTDGSLSCNGFDFIAKHKTLSEDVAFVARSLGLAAYVTQCRKVCTNTQVAGTYWRVSISGDCDTVPCRLPHKKAAPRRQKKNVLRTGLKVERAGSGPYNGFVIDGDRRFLLGDFTVTHNTINALNFAAERGRSTLVITDREFLGFEQWIPEAKDKLGLTDAQIGIVQGDVCQHDREFVVGMAASIIKNNYPEEFYSAFGTLILDELHKFGAPGMSTILSMFSAEAKLGQTATPKRGDGTQQIFLDYFGPCQIKAEGSALPCQIKVVDYEDDDGRAMPGSHGARMQRLARDDNRNRVLVKEIMEMYNEGRQILVIGDDIKHLQRLEQMCWSKGVPKDRTGQFSRERYILISEPGEHNGQKAIIKRQKKARVTNEYLNWCKQHARLIFSTYGMMKEGIDIPRLDGGIDVTPRREGVQVIGRIRRPLPGKRVPKWVTVRDTTHKSLMRYFEERMRDYQSSNVEVMYND